MWLCPKTQSEPSCAGAAPCIPWEAAGCAGRSRLLCSVALLGHACHQSREHWNLMNQSTGANSKACGWRTSTACRSLSPLQPSNVPVAGKQNNPSGKVSHHKSYRKGFWREPSLSRRGAERNREGQMKTAHSQHLRWKAPFPAEKVDGKMQCCVTLWYQSKSQCWPARDCMGLWSHTNNSVPFKQMKKRLTWMSLGTHMSCPSRKRAVNRAVPVRKICGWPILLQASY